MKKVKIYLGVIMILIGNIGFAQGQGGRQGGGQQGPPPIPNKKQIEKIVSDLSREISLTSEQEASVLKLYNNYFAEVKEKTSENDRPQREEMEALKSEFEAKVKALLTPEQQAKFVEYQRNNKPRQPGRKML